MRLLLVEDDLHLAEAVSHILRQNQYTVDCVHDGLDGYDYGLSGIYDVIILDIMLPSMDGISVLTELRKNKIVTPILMLTAKSQLEDKVNGLNQGADDYLTKPFATEELLARINALSRRKGDVQSRDALLFGDIHLNHDNLTLFCHGNTIKLTLKEADLLEFLIHQQGIVTSKELLIEKLWGFDSDAEHNNVEVYISFLRKKLNFLGSNVLITTTRGVGYSLEESKHV